MDVAEELHLAARAARVGVCVRAVRAWRLGRALAAWRTACVRWERVVDASRHEAACAALASQLAHARVRAAELVWEAAATRRRVVNVHWV